MILKGIMQNLLRENMIPKGIMRKYVIGMDRRENESGTTIILCFNPLFLIIKFFQYVSFLQKYNTRVKYVS